MAGGRGTHLAADELLSACCNLLAKAGIAGNPLHRMRCVIDIWLRPLLTTGMRIRARGNVNQAGNARQLCFVHELQIARIPGAITGLPSKSTRQGPHKPSARCSDHSYRTRIADPTSRHAANWHR